jgi:hypothetical protein
MAQTARQPARVTPKRQRDYAAEYKKRTAGARTVAERRKARGHAQESAEKKARRARIKEEYGVTPERLAKLRREAQAHIIAELDRVGTRHRINPETIKIGLRRLNAEALERIRLIPGEFLKGLASLQIGQFSPLRDSWDYYDEDINPFWYS